MEIQRELEQEEEALRGAQHLRNVAKVRRYPLKTGVRPFSKIINLGVLVKSDKQKSNPAIRLGEGVFGGLSVSDWGGGVKRV